MADRAVSSLSFLYRSTYSAALTPLSSMRMARVVFHDRSIDFARTDEDRQAMDLVYSQGLFGRPYFVMPGVPAERVAALRKAFMDTFRDPEIIAEAARMQLDIDALSGDEVQAEVAKAFTTPRNIVERARQAMIYKSR